MKSTTIASAAILYFSLIHCVVAQLPRLGGVNTPGYEFTLYENGTFTNNPHTPPAAQFPHFSAEGANLYRVPFAWQQMTPVLGGSINTSFLAQYNATVQAALDSSADAHVIIDLHNYARWNGKIIAQGGPTNTQFASVWSQLSKFYGANDRLIFGIMNEPHDLDIAAWATSVQYVVNDIRAAGATNYLLIPGSNYTSAQYFPTYSGPHLLNLTDPLGGTGRLIFDVHKYLDSDNSGTHPDCVTNNVAILETLVHWLEASGNRQALLSETGGGNTASCKTFLGQELAYVNSTYPTLVGYSIWAAGAFDSSYVLSVTPFRNETDQSLWTNAVKPYLP